MEQQEHTHEEQSQGTSPVQPREPSMDSIARALQERLSEKQKQVQDAESRVDYFVALANDLNGELAGLQAMFDQVAAENKMLRKQCGYAETGPIDFPESSETKVQELRPRTNGRKKAK
jgi:peptidoglycan hydrolase CwlO-like protein